MKTLSLILLLGLVLRIGLLDDKLPKRGFLSPLNTDEAIPYSSLENMAKNNNLSPSQSFFWGSLHTYLLGLTLQTAKIAGFVRVDSREYLKKNPDQVKKLYVIGRLLSVMFGLLSIFIIFLIGKQLYCIDVGLLSAVFLAVTPLHIEISTIVRPDSMMIFLVLSAIYFSFKFDYKYLLISGFLCGLAGATKYNGILFLIFPLLANLSKYSCTKEYIFIFLSALIGFLIGCPYSIIDFNTFAHYLRLNYIMSSTGLSGRGFVSYFTTFLPQGMGILSIFGTVGMIWFYIRHFNDDITWDQWYRNMIFAVAFPCIYFVTAFSKHQVVHYTLPAIPFMVMFAAYFFKDAEKYFNEK